MVVITRWSSYSIYNEVVVRRGSTIPVLAFQFSKVWMVLCNVNESF